MEDNMIFASRLKEAMKHNNQMKQYELSKISGISNTTLSRYINGTRTPKVSEIIKDIPVSYFYSSEKYGKYVAEYLDINNVLVDENRVNYPISAGMIRNDIEKYKEFLDIKVLNDLTIIYKNYMEW